MKRAHVACFIGAVLLVAPLPLAAAEQSAPQSGSAVTAAGTIWSRFTKLTLEVSDPSRNYEGSFVFDMAGTRDLMLSVDLLDKGVKSDGTILMVGGRVMATKGLDLDERKEVDALDGPVIMSKIAMGLLQYLFPDGPTSLSRRSEFGLTEKARGLQVATPTSKGVFPPPWGVKGYAEKVKGKVVFDLAFSFAPDPDVPNTTEMKFRGEWEQGTPPRFPDTMPLAGWKVYTLGPGEEKTEKGKILVYAARPRKGEFATMGELRKSLGDH